MTMISCMYLVVQLFTTPLELLLARYKCKACFCNCCLFFELNILFWFLVPNNRWYPSLKHFSHTNCCFSHMLQVLFTFSIYMRWLLRFRCWLDFVIFYLLRILCFGLKSFWLFLVTFYDIYICAFLYYSLGKWLRI